MKLSHFLSFPPFLPFFLELFLTTLLSHTQIWINTSIRMHNIPLHNTVPPWYTILPPLVNSIWFSTKYLKCLLLLQHLLQLWSQQKQVQYLSFCCCYCLEVVGGGIEREKVNIPPRMQSWEGANILVSRKAPSLSCWAFVLRTHAIYSNRVNMYYNATNE